MFFVMQMLYICVEDAIGNHTEEAYSRAGLITAL